MSASPAYRELLARLGEIQDLSKIQMLLFWDQRVTMPERGAAARAEQVGSVTRLLYQRFASDELAWVLDELRAYEESLDYDSDDAGIIRVTRRDHEKARRVPPELRGEMMRAASQALPAWERARRESSWEVFLPFLRRNFQLRREYVACFDDYDEPYDVLLDDFEPRMKTSEVRAVFGVLKPELIGLVAEVGECEQIEDAFLRGPFPIDRQWQFERRLLDQLGLTADSWRFDETFHPFASSMSPLDVRITTKHHEDRLDSLFSTLHEFGHGLYEHQVSVSLERTPLCRAGSFALHESQSRMWENLIGRGLPFWRRFYRELQETFPERLAGVDLGTFYRGINKVEPSLIRIEADEITYSLHIVLRFELEQEMLSGAIDLEDVPEAWEARMREYLGVEVPDVADGALQDMHWAFGHIGYFSTYALGNVISVQLWERALEDLPDLEEQIEQGEFAPLREWLGRHVHRHGRKFLPRELLERVVGGPIDPQPYLGYLRRKLGEIYGLPVAA